MNRQKKLTVLIVEDEHSLAEHLERRITAISSRFQVLAIAANGSEGLQLLAQGHPDIVFCDIRMPVMDGLEFLEKASKLRSGAKYVILSGFSDFQYAQTAIRYGVKDYLLKPLSDEKLYEALSKIVTEIETTDIPGRYAEVQSLLAGPAGGRRPGRAERLFHLALLTVGNCMNSASYFSSETEESFETLLNSIDFAGIIDGLIPDQAGTPMLLGGSMFNTRFLVFDDPHLTDQAFSSFCAAFHQKLSALPNLLPVTLTVHPGAFSAAQLYAAGRDLNKYYLSHYTPWKPAVLQAGADTVLRFCNALNFDAIVQAFRISHYDTARQALLALLTEWYDQNVPVSQFYQNIQFLLQSLRRRTPEQDSEEWNLLIADNMFYFFFSPTFQSFCQKEFESLAGYFHIQKDAWSAESIMEGVRSYIDEHYREPVNICELATRFYISPSHLSRQFKQMYGRSPSSYLIDKRITHACTLLRDNPELEAKSISSLVGYSDQFHFSKIFKKHTGFAPSDYRKNMP